MVEKNTVRRAYDDLADEYAAARSDDGRGMAVLSQFLDDAPSSARVLDAGCGQGRPVLAHLSDSAEAVGLDFSREQLRLAADNAPDAALAQGDMTTLPFPDGAFDAVVAFWSLIHVPMDDHQTVVDEFARVLRPGGRVLLCEGTEEWCGENPDWLDTGVQMAWHIAGADATRDQLRTAGFAVVDDWGAPETLAGEESDGDEWTFFAARLEQ